MQAKRFKKDSMYEDVLVVTIYCHHLPASSPGPFLK